MNAPAYTIDWFSQNIEALTQVLAKFKGRPNVRALEIGCFEGRGTLWLLDNILTGQGSWIHCIDTFTGSAEHEHFGIGFADTFQRFTENVPVNRRTLDHQESSEALRRLCKEFDIAYIDGSHTAPDVLSDLVLTWPLIKKGGIMFMDDFLWPGTDQVEQHRPRIAIEAFLSIFTEQLKIVYQGYSVAVEKLI